MQSCEKKVIDARTFVQLCASLTKREKDELTHRIILSLHCTDRSVRYWMSGEHAPVGYTQRKAIASAVKSVLGLPVTDITLFP